MKTVEIAPAQSCPDCGQEMKCNAILPATDELPPVAGYWCNDCKKEVTVELD